MSKQVNKQNSSSNAAKATGANTVTKQGSNSNVSKQATGKSDKAPSNTKLPDTNKPTTTNQNNVKITKEGLLSFPEKYDIPSDFYLNHRKLLVENIKKEANPGKKSILMFKGVPTIDIDDQDIQEKACQYDSFFYLFGVEQPDCYAVIELDTGKTILFPNKIPDSYKLWMVVYDKEYYKTQYRVDDAQYSENLEKYLQEYKPECIYLYDGVNSDSGLSPNLPTFDFLKNYKIDKDQLYWIFHEQRTVKDKIEIELIRFSCKIASDAHVRVMRNTKPGLIEYQMEALFKFHCFERCGAQFKPYDCICGSGRSPSVLHYIENQEKIADNVLILNDMGCKYQNYISDITVTFPSNGKFNEKQKNIYLAVLDARDSVNKVLKAGVKWEDMHMLAEEKLLNHLIKFGLIKDTPIKELQEKRVGAVFFPHGLGHFFGTRAHDVGGYNKGCPERHTKAGLKSLRTRRTLKAGNCITVEPGLYFVDHILENAYKDPELAPYLVKSKIDEYYEVGGVRIEDCVGITETGIIQFTNVPRTIEEIELCMAGKEWKK